MTLNTLTTAAEAYALGLTDTERAEAGFTPLAPQPGTLIWRSLSTQVIEAYRAGRTGQPIPTTPIYGTVIDTLEGYDAWWVTYETDLLRVGGEAFIQAEEVYPDWVGVETARFVVAAGGRWELSVEDDDEVVAVGRAVNTPSGVTLWMVDRMNGRPSTDWYYSLRSLLVSFNTTASAW